MLSPLNSPLPIAAAAHDGCVAAASLLVRLLSAGGMLVRTWEPLYLVLQREKEGGVFFIFSYKEAFEGVPSKVYDSQVVPVAAPTVLTLPIRRRPLEKYLSLVGSSRQSPKRTHGREPVIVR